MLYFPGKLYKSRVCFIKHIWEHSIYWDLFDGEKNHDRVLSIQAALILYSSHQGTTPRDQGAAPPLEPNDNDLLTSLLVTSPHDKKKECNTKDLNNNNESPTTSDRKLCTTPTKRSSPSKKSSPSKRRRRSSSGSSTTSQMSTSCQTVMMECSSEASPQNEELLHSPFIC